MLLEERYLTSCAPSASQNCSLSADTAKSVLLSEGAIDVLGNRFSLVFSFAGELLFISQDLAVIASWKEGVTFE